jgi:aspartyl-tRNA(Asn)/glutamyl-tRNA(Gln) amidotransferase subunit A
MMDGGIAGFGDRLRGGKITAEAATRAYLARIEALEPRLGVFEHVAAESALDTARALDGLLAAGTDLGPLMGVPVAIKDILAVDGMPATAGSDVDVADLIGAEGTFVKSLRRAGCVILGKVKTVEFAAGGTGINYVRGTPWNPWDAETQREPSGSSSGSAVAVAAGLSAFAIGSDTTGSVRGPAAHCGVFGLKTTKGLWPTDGVFPLSPTLDTIGPLTQTAADCAVVFSGLTDGPVAAPAAPGGLRLGKPTALFYDNLDADVERCTAAALEALAGAGVEIVPVEIPEAAEVVGAFAPFLPIELIAVLGRDRFEAGRDRMDPVVASRAAEGLDVTADDYIRLLWRQRELCRVAAERMAGFDGWVTPTRPTVPPPVVGRAEAEAKLPLPPNRWPNTPAGSLFGLCGTSSPIHALGAELPVGLQVMCPAGADSAALSIARMIEDIVGPPPRADMASFL